MLEGTSKEAERSRWDGKMLEARGNGKATNVHICLGGVAGQEEGLDGVESWADLAEDEGGKSGPWEGSAGGQGGGRGGGRRGEGGVRGWEGGRGAPSRGGGGVEEEGETGKEKEGEGQVGGET